MIITEKQLILLIQCLRDTLGIYGIEFTMKNDSRIDLYNQIISQQSEKLMVVE